jgi:short-subunit dehydrogenase
MTKGKPGTGQTALVTGASMGIGVDLAECFAMDGYDLILAARSEAALREVAARLSTAYAVKAHVFTVDLAERGSGGRLAEAIKAAGLEVDVLVNNAGFGKAGAFAERAGTGATRFGQTAAVMDSMPVAQAGYAGFRKNQRVVITGKGNHRTAKMVPFLPRSMVLKMVRNIQSPAAP